MQPRDRVNRAFSRAASSYEQSAVVQKEVASRLVSLLPDRLVLEQVYEFGCGTGLLTRALEERCHITHWHINDLSSVMLEQLSPLGDKKPSLWVGDAVEVTPYHLLNSFDLIASASTLQWFSDPLGYLSKIFPMLKDVGMLLFSTFGERNLYELRMLTGRGLDYISMEEIGDFMHRHFYEVTLFEEQIPLAFPNLLTLFRHLKETGVTQLLKNNTPSLLTSREALEQLESRYRELYWHSDGGLSLTYHPIYVKASLPKR
ncbi:malonyl-ACP O-methyltransferase BioC [Porphyromonas gingivicanis]|uniref:malonyl-ACP O-methyltransferase BioC n=1 Tax=Porphyromonas gingivicanis TaxID=266762 RepID=UPI000470BF99|nr:malonyl-ACP O-methyltransferase BioC [Porphyromonas gingivicanis]